MSKKHSGIFFMLRQQNLKSSTFSTKTV